MTRLHLSTARGDSFPGATCTCTCIGLHLSHRSDSERLPSFVSRVPFAYADGAWLYIPEIMPLRVRGKAVGLATFINWGPANFASAFLTPWMLQKQVLGAGGTLLFFGCIAACFVPYAALLLPETKGKPLEKVLPMFEFDGCTGFRQFVVGNIRHGCGVGAPSAAGPAQGPHGGGHAGAEGGLRQRTTRGLPAEVVVAAASSPNVLELATAGTSTSSPRGPIQPTVQVQVHE